MEFSYEEESPGKLRLKALSSKLSQLHSGIEEEKQARSTAFDSKVKGLEEKLARQAIAEETKFKLLKD